MCWHWIRVQNSQKRQKTRHSASIWVNKKPFRWSKSSQTTRWANLPQIQWRCGKKIIFSFRQEKWPQSLKVGIPNRSFLLANCFGYRLFWLRATVGGLMCFAVKCFPIVSLLMFFKKQFHSAPTGRRLNLFWVSHKFCLKLKIDKWIRCNLIRGIIYLLSEQIERLLQTKLRTLSNMPARKTQGRITTFTKSLGSQTWKYPTKKENYFTAIGFHSCEGRPYRNIRPGAAWKAQQFCQRTTVQPL